MALRCRLRRNSLCPDFISTRLPEILSPSPERTPGICRSLRMEAGETLILCDGAGTDYNGILRQADGTTATVEILSRQPSQTEPTVFIRLFQALPKGDKMEWILQKAVELGVSEVVPVLTERCIPARTKNPWIKKAGTLAENRGGSRQAVRPQPYSYRCPLMSFSQAVQALGSMERDCFFTKKAACL